MKQKPLTIGLTGGIASGKSQISSYFIDLGITVIDSDKIARDCFMLGSPHLDKLRDRFGDSIFQINGELDRKSLGKIVFSNNQQLEWLNDFTHPLINMEMKRQLANCRSTYVILDIPLLINKQGMIPNHLKSLIDRVLVVKTELNTQIERIIKRDGITKKEAHNIIDSQSTMEQKLLLADDIIDNNGSLVQLKQQVNKLHNQYTHGTQQ